MVIVIMVMVKARPSRKYCPVLFSKAPFSSNLDQIKLHLILLIHSNGFLLDIHQSGPVFTNFSHEQLYLVKLFVGHCIVGHICYFAIHPYVI